jgi:hypothetical protein
MSINIEEQVAYWQNGAREELDTAKLLLNNNKVNQGFFWAQHIWQWKRRSKRW